MKFPQSFPKDRPDSFPFKAGRGRFIVTMYRFAEKTDYETFKLPYEEGGRRRFHRFATYEEARDKGNEMIGQLVDGQHSAITLTNNDKLVYLRAIDLLKSLGIGLDSAVGAFSEASNILSGTGISVIEAARDYVKRHKNTIQNKDLSTAVDEFITAKTAAGKSDVYLSDLNYRLGKLKINFNCKVSDVSEEMLRRFLDGLKLSPRSHNNFLTTFVCFFRWCIKKKYLASDWNEFASIEKVKAKSGKITIYTPEEMAALLKHAGEELLPFLAIGAFAGLRSSEICRLEWRHVWAHNGEFIELTEDVAEKTNQRRLVPISTNLLKWLKPYATASGKVWPHTVAYLYEVLEQVTEKAETKWKQNALRHSYISYRMAKVEDAAKVSLEAGNSPQMVFKNYRRVVTPKESKRWFSIRPGKSAEGKITWLKLAA